MKMQLQNSFGASKEVKIGFSWTTFFFGIFPAIFRGDGLGVVHILLVNLASILLAANLHPIFFFTYLIIPFTYNHSYTQRLLDQGYRPNGDGIYQLKIKGFNL
jgi:hypothetical protein